MANTREIKLIEKEFLELEKENKNLILDTKIDNKKMSTTDDHGRQSPTIADNRRQLYFYENSLKNSTNNFLELKKNTNLELKGCGILNIRIKENINLELNFENKYFNNIIIKILVLENKKLNLIDFTNSKFLYKNIQIILEENSELNYSQFIINSKISHSNILLNKNSKYNLKSVYFSNNSKNYILNKVEHLQKNSQSNLEINGLAKNNSKIINDAQVLIKNSAKKSISHQKMKNLILDETSQIQSEPILEVENNDVICSHASSISQINDEVLFYMNSRGINYNDAIKLIANSYFNLVIENLIDKKLKIKYENILEKNIFNTNL